MHVALARESRDRGVLVVMNDQIHAAARVRKGDSLSVNAFESPNGGPVGQLFEGQVHYWHIPGHRTVLPEPDRVQHQVGLMESCLDADTGLLDAALGLGYEGLVIAGFGAGHVSEHWASSLERIARQIPVIVATRTGRGTTASASYGFVGSEIDLQKKGMQWPVTYAPANAGYCSGRCWVMGCRTLCTIICAETLPAPPKGWARQALPRWLMC